MTPSRLRRIGRAARTHATYALDNMLGMSPLWQLLVLLLFAALLVLLMRLVVEVPIGQPIPTGRPLWWVLTLMMDGGTMATGERLRTLRAQVVAFVTSLIGVLLLSLITAALASKMAERLHELRTGRSPIVERGHVLVLGYDRKVPLIARELARSRKRVTLVILSPEPRERIDAVLRPLRRLPRSRLRLVVRSGDPRSDHALQVVAAAAARAVLVLPPPHLDEEAAVRWTLSVMLAVRQTAECGFRGQVVLETSRAEARQLLLLAAEAGVAGPEALPTEIIASDDLIARMLVQSVRQEGVYHALRKMLTFDHCDVHLAKVPRALVGRTFDGAHEAVSGAVLLGVRRASGDLHLNPTPEEPLFLEETDRLVLLAAGPRSYQLDGRLPTLDHAPADPALRPRPPARLSLLGTSRRLLRTVEELGQWLPPGSVVRVICPGGDPTEEARLQALPAAIGEVRVELDRRSPLRLAEAGDPALYEADAIVILGADEAEGEGGDAAALTMLLGLRHGARCCGRSLRRVVTEVRDPRSAHQVAAMANDILVGSELVAMLFAQQALDPLLAPVYGELLSPCGNGIALGPRAAYVPAGPATFADVAAAARQRGEVAIGLFEEARPGAPGRAVVDLNPPRAREVPAGAAVVVLARSRPALQ